MFNIITIALAFATVSRLLLILARSRVSSHLIRVLLGRQVALVVGRPGCRDGLVRGRRELAGDAVVPLQPGFRSRFLKTPLPAKDNRDLTRKTPPCRLE